MRGSAHRSKRARKMSLTRGVAEVGGGCSIGRGRARQGRSRRARARRHARAATPGGRARRRGARLNGVERLREVGEQVGLVLDADGEADEAVGQARRAAPSAGIEPCVMRRRVRDQALDAAEALGEREDSSCAAITRTAVSSASSTSVNETMPPKPRIWRAAISWPGWSSKPGQRTSATFGWSRRKRATASPFAQWRSMRTCERLDARAAPGSSRTGPARRRATSDRKRRRSAQSRRPTSSRRRRRRRSGRRGTSSSSGRRGRRRARAAAGGTGVANVLSTASDDAALRARRSATAAMSMMLQQRVRRRLDPDEPRRRRDGRARRVGVGGSTKSNVDPLRLVDLRA